MNTNHASAFLFSHFQMFRYAQLSQLVVAHTRARVTDLNFWKMVMQCEKCEGLSYLDLFK